MTPISSRFIRQDECLIVRFCNKQDVYVLSTVDTAGTIQKKRILSGGEVRQYQKPTVIDKYNQTMGGIDRCDQIISPITCVRRTHAWFKKLGLHLCQRLVLNAAIRYSKEKEKMTFMKFTLVAVSHLTGIPMTRERHRSLPKPVPTEDVRVELHLLVPFPPTGNNPKSRKRYRNCYKQSKRADTQYFCDGCEAKPALCIDCFVP